MCCLEHHQQCINSVLKRDTSGHVQNPVFGFGRVGRHIRIGGIISCRRGAVFCQYAVFRRRVVSRTPLRGNLFRRRGKIAQGGTLCQGPCAPCGLEAGFMDKVPGLFCHLVQPLQRPCAMPWQKPALSSEYAREYKKRIGDCQSFSCSPTRNRTSI